MSYKTQEKHMKKLAELTSQNLSHIFGEREGGPNGVKREFLQTGKTFLRALAKDLRFTESRVFDAPGGIGVGGDVTLMGMWGKENGIYFTLRGENDFLGPVMFRTIRHLKDYAGGNNRWPPRDFLQTGYQNLLDRLTELKEGAGDARADERAA